MKPINIIKMSVDCAMALLLLLLMAFHITRETVHMVLGAAMATLVIAHLVLNRGWIRTMHKGRYNAVRVFRLVFNGLLFLVMAGLMASGIMMSPIRRIFYFLPFASRIDTARTLHHVLAYWGFILIAMHIGIYAKKIAGMLRPKTNQPRKGRGIILRVITILIAAYGIYAFINRELYSYMFLITQYTFFDYEQPVFLFFVDYLSIMALFIIIAHYPSVLIAKRFSNKAAV
ncbi:hypothetical protein PilKf_01656 [Pillotina sp. SPG140]|jgi:hypothetical protein